MFFDSEDWQTIIFRLSMAMAVGCLIGYNRQRGGRPAGLRTFIIVSLGAAMFVMIPLQAEGDVGYASSNALSRTIQGVASGVGFLQMVLVGTFFTLSTLSGIKRLKKKQPLAKYIKGRKKISRINQEIDSSDNSASH